MERAPTMKEDRELRLRDLALQVATLISTATQQNAAEMMLTLRYATELVHWLGPQRNQGSENVEEKPDAKVRLLFGDRDLRPQVPRPRQP